MKTRLILRIVLFAVVYTVIFHLFRTSHYYNYKILTTDLDSIPWLYTTIGSIFSILSAFIIQKEWQRWDNLVDAVKGENNALRELWFWTGRLPQDIQKNVRSSVEEYCNVIVRECWKRTEIGETSPELEIAIRKMNSAIARLKITQSYLTSSTFSIFNHIMRYRERRLRYGSSHMPAILLNTFRFAVILMIFLCPLIVVKSIELDYIFTISIAVLTFTIYSVVIDLDRPLRPGSWHLTTRDYQRTLNHFKRYYEEGASSEVIPIQPLKNS